MLEVISKSMIYIYNTNDIIYYQNSMPSNLFLILNGEVCFKKYNNLEIFAMIGGEENIIISKRRYTDNNAKVIKKSMIDLRNHAFNKGKEDSNKKNGLSCGNFFGEENLVYNLPYTNCAIANKDSIIIGININVFNLNLKKKVEKTLENIRNIISIRFPFFKCKEENYMNIIFKIFPENGEIICREKELYNKLYLIFQGKCIVQKNSKNLGNILYLNEGDLFGYESLFHMPKKFDENYKIKILENEYTIVNNDDSSIILKLNIPFLDEHTTWRIHCCLKDYFKKQKKIIKKLEKIKNISTNILQDNYNNIVIRKIRKKFPNKSSDDSSFTNIKNKNYHLFVNNILASEKKIFKYKIINRRKVNLLSEFIKKFPRNYFKSISNSNISKKMKHSTDERNNMKININYLTNNNIKLYINRNNFNLDNFPTPKKSRNLLTCNKIKNEKNKESSIISNYININSSNTLRRLSTCSKFSTLGESKNIKNIYNINEIKLKNKIKLILKKSNSNDKTKINNICSKNDSKIVSKFEYNNNENNYEYDDGFPFIISQTGRGISTNQKRSIDKSEYINRNTNINVYSYPFFYEDGN